MSTTLLVIFLVPSLGLLLLGCIFWLTAYRDTATVFNLMAVCTQVVSAFALWMSRKDVVTLFGVQKLPSGLLIPILRDTTGVVKISETLFLVHQLFWVGVGGVLAAVLFSFVTFPKVFAPNVAAGFTLLAAIIGIFII